ncbi:polysaccharide deacetylase family protein [Candidatus Woesearchaeota archaeon]|nr:polysaccharide deacetylase family protein [Candidatus Woesearchaeota archaeon]
MGLVRTAQNLAASLIWYSGLGRLLHNNMSPRFTVLMYHRIAKDKESIEYFPDVYGGTSKTFDAQMRFLAEHCNLISFDELDDILSGKKSAPKHAVLVTFDDGYKDNHDVAYPILKKYKIPCTFALSTGFVGHKRLMWWDQLSYVLGKTTKDSIKVEATEIELKDHKRALRKITKYMKTLTEKKKRPFLESLSNELGVVLPEERVSMTWDEVRNLHGITLSAHTVNHPIMTKIPLAEAKKEAMDSVRKIERETGNRVTIFTYPNGKKADMSSDLDAYLHHKGIRFILTTLYRENDYRISAPFIINRKGVNIQHNLSMFRLQALGVDTFLQGYIKRFL